MSPLDDRLAESLGGAYRDSFGPAPAGLPEPARGRGAALTAGVVVVAAAVAVPLILANTGSGTAKTSPAGRSAVLETESPTPARTPVCGPGDVKLTAYLNTSHYPESVLEQPLAKPGAFLGYGELSATTTTPCRGYLESTSIGLVTPSGHYLGPDPAPSCLRATVRHNLSAPLPVSDPLALACITPAPMVSDGMSGTVIRPTEIKDDFGVLLSNHGEVSLPSDDITDVGADGARRFAEQHAGRGTSPEPVFTAFRVDLANNPHVPPSQVEAGTWRLRVTYGNLAAEAPFEVTAG